LSTLLISISTISHQANHLDMEHEQMPEDYFE